MSEEIIGMECRWCLSKSLRPVAVGAKARWVLENPRSQTVSNLIKCDGYTLTNFDAASSEYELTQMYSGYRNSEYLRQRRKYEPWYTKPINDAIGHSAEVLQLRRQHLESVLNEALKSGELGLVSPTRVLDVVGDEGQFIPDIETITIKAVLEVSGARPVKGAQVSETWNEAIDFKPDMIMMCHVLEHIENARENVKNAARALDQGGFFVYRNPFGQTSQYCAIILDSGLCEVCKIALPHPDAVCFGGSLESGIAKICRKTNPGCINKAKWAHQFF